MKTLNVIYTSLLVHLNCYLYLKHVALVNCRRLLYDAETVTDILYCEYLFDVIAKLYVLAVSFIHDIFSIKYKCTCVRIKVHVVYRLQGLPNKLS